jgi:hypothetical protein
VTAPGQVLCRETLRVLLGAGRRAGGRPFVLMTLTLSAWEPSARRCRRGEPSPCIRRGRDAPFAQDAADARAAGFSGSLSAPESPGEPEE